MPKYITRRLALSIPVLLGVSLVVFAVLRLIPGNPAQIMLFGSNATPQELARLEAQLGLTKPLAVQYLIFIGQLLHGNLGKSYITGDSIGWSLATRFPDTLELTMAGMAVALLLGVPLGILAGLRAHTWIDRAATGVVVLGTAVPYFWLALLLIMVLAVRLQWLPAVNNSSPQSVVLPAISLGTGFAAIIARLLRNNLIDVYQQPYMVVAKAKGLSGAAMLWSHAIKNAMIPVVTIVGLQFGNMLTGAVVIEVIFGRPGIGSFLANAILAKDIPAVQGTVLFIAVVYLVINLLVDISYGYLDPRIRSGLVQQ